MKNPIKKLRQDLDMKQEDFAKKIKISQSYLSKIERDEVQANTETLRNLYKVYKFNVGKYIARRYK